MITAIVALALGAQAFAPARFLVGKVVKARAPMRIESPAGKQLSEASIRPGLKIYEGDRVLVSGDGVLVIEQSNGVSQTWRQSKTAAVVEYRRSPQDEKFAREVGKKAVAAVSKAGPSIIRWPNGHTVARALFTIQLDLKDQTVDARIEKYGEVLWSGQLVRASGGFYYGKGIEEALDHADRELDFTLVVRDAEAKFRVIDDDAESSLRDALSKLAGEDAGLAFKRAAVLGKMGLSVPARAVLSQLRSN